MGLASKLGVGAACALGTLALCRPALAQPTTVYVSNYTGTGGITEYPIGPGGELQTDVVAATAQAQTWYEAVTPDGKYLYATNNDGLPSTVNQYRIGNGGALTALAPATVPAGDGPTTIAVAPDGKHVYVNEEGSNAVAIFDVTASGTLTPNVTQPSETTNLNAASALAVSPDGKSLYVTNDAGASVAEFNVAGNGTLTPKTNPTVSAGSDPTNIVLTPNGRFAYVTDWGLGSISEYRVGAGGQLIHNGITPGVGVKGDELYSATVSPDGRSLYAPNDAAIYQFNIGSTGVLAAKPAVDVPTGPGAENLWFTADGRSAYSANYDNTTGSVSEWDLLSGGELGPKSTPTVTPVPGAAVVMIAPDQGPVASFSDTPAHVGAPTHFNGAASHDSDGMIARFDWSFGDGVTAHNAGPALGHVFSRPGVYKVTLTVTDEEGCSTSFVFTGVTAYCNGTAAARKTRKVTIPAIPPKAFTGAARHVRRHSAMLTGRVSPNGVATRYRFQYGKTARYGHQTTRTSAGAVTFLRAVSVRLSGLKPGTTYHYRIVATNQAGTTRGRDRTFATAHRTAHTRVAFTG